MKKLFTLAAAAVVALSASAQQKTLADSKLSDNWYIGLHGGVNTKTTKVPWMKSLNPTAGLRVGRWITPCWGMFLDADVDFANKNAFGVEGVKIDGDVNIVRAWNFQLGVQTNLMNLFAGYKGQPRLFEINPLLTLGWGHRFFKGVEFGDEYNTLTSKVGIDFAFNLGKSKAWQIYIEPAMCWAVAGDCSTFAHEYADEYRENIGYNINRSKFQLTAGFIYKFKNSNGTHNFALVDVRDQAEIDGLNGKINDLRGTISGKDAEIARLKKALSDCENKPAPVPVVVEKPVKVDPMQTNLMPKVIFKVGKSNVDASQVANIEMIAKYMKSTPAANVLIKGYASPEGNAEKNQALSEKRAEAVKTMLIKKYGIDAARLTTEGCGATSELSDVVDFNRVATFSDTTKK